MEIASVSRNVKDIEYLLHVLSS